MKAARFALAVVCPLVLGLAAFGSEPDPPTPDRIPPDPLVLPLLTVPGEFSAEGWCYTRTDSTEFLSQLSKKITKNLSDDFVIFQQFVRANFPEAALPATSPFTIVLCTNPKDFRLFAPNAHTTVFQFSNSERLLLVDANAMRLEMIERVIRARWLELGYRHQPRNQPLWQELGTQNLLLALQVTTKNHLEFGFPPFNPHSKGGQVILPRGTIIPLFSVQFGLGPGDTLPSAQMFTMTRRSPKSAEKSQYKMSMQATAFMHLCLFSAKQRQLRQPYAKFVARLDTAPFSEELFRECFGKSTQEMDWLLYDYIFSSDLKYETKRYRYSPAEAAEVREAKPAEVLRLLRECQRLLPSPAAETRP
jgi:hypothetical protein